MHKKKIPLGLSSYKEIVTEGYYYVDKTHYIETLENLGTKYQILLRPRRFGKTLFGDTLGCYYDLAEAESFDVLFGSTYIGKHKTPLANSFYVLKLNLSGLDSRDPERLEAAFDRAIKSRIDVFLDRYDLAIELKEEEPFVSYMDNFLNKLGKEIKSKKLFIIIDEYDHFANSLLGSREDFMTATSKEGYIRNFYEVLKVHTQDVISRIFITGVTSLTLDSLTSGFNISENISDYPAINEAMGFTYDEVADLVDYLEIPDKPDVLQILKDNYNGYLFSPQSTERIYNSNMILYFMTSYLNRGFPERLADPNIRGDYLKLSAMFDLYEEQEEKEVVLQSLMSGQSVTGRLETSFGLIESFTYDHFLSLLYYLGLLTLERGLTGGRYQFKTPNQVIREVYYDYYFNYLTETSDVTNAAITQAVRRFEESCDIDGLIEVVEIIIDDFTKSNNRYMIHFRENTLQTLFFLLLRKSNEYNAQMEYKAGNGYIDIFLAPIHDKAACAIEFKYISTSRAENEENILQEIQAKVDEQIAEDCNLPGVASGIGIVFAGKKCVYKCTLM